MMHGQTDEWFFANTGPNTGSWNMQADESAARALARGSGRCLVRLFRWQPWAISLGYNQREEDIDTAKAARDGIDIARRPTGGRAILHAEELTYSVVMYAGRRSVLQVYNEISSALVAGLRLFGVDVSLQKSQPNFVDRYRHASSIPCFTASARYEIEWRDRKLVGSAQRRFSDGERDVVLQHGSILCGPAHKRLAEYLRVADSQVLAQVRKEMAEKTVDLSEILGRAVDMGRLEECIRAGFEQAWGITFEPARSAPGSVHEGAAIMKLPGNVS